MNVLVVTWDGGGNRFPFRALTDELRRRRHNITVLSEGSAATRWEDADVEFRAWGPEVEVVRSDRMPEADRIPLILERLWFGLAPALELRTVIDAGAFDGYVLDHSLASCGAVTESLGLPTAVLYHTVRRALRLSPPRFDAWLARLNSVRATYRLAPLHTVADAWAFAPLRIIPSGRAYDAPQLEADPGDLYVGPIAPTRTSGRPPTIEGHGPLVLVSFSTTWQEQLPALQETIDGLAPMPLRVLVTVGPEIDPAELQVPSGVTVAQFVAHPDVLPVTDVVVTHAGHGTVMASLKAGIPLVCLPMGRDQFMNARLVEACGAGIQIAAAGEIPAAVSKVLATPAYRTAAEGMAREIAREPGVGAAADAVEDLIR